MNIISLLQNKNISFHEKNSYYAEDAQDFKLRFSLWSKKYSVFKEEFDPVMCRDFMADALTFSAKSYPLKDRNNGSIYGFKSFNLNLAKKYYLGVYLPCDYDEYEKNSRTRTEKWKENLQRLLSNIPVLDQAKYFHIENEPNILLISFPNDIIKVPFLLMLTTLIIRSFIQLHEYEDIPDYNNFLKFINESRRKDFLMLKEFRESVMPITYFYMYYKRIIDTGDFNNKKFGLNSRIPFSDKRDFHNSSGVQSFSKYFKQNKNRESIREHPTGCYDYGKLWIQPIKNLLTEIEVDQNVL